MLMSVQPIMEIVTKCAPIQMEAMHAHVALDTCLALTTALAMVG